MKRVLQEAWIIAAEATAETALAPLVDVAGMPHLLRHACAAKAAKASTVYVIWRGDSSPPDLADIASDPRLDGTTLTVVTEAPEGPGDDAILILRSDRVFHRDLPKRVAEHVPNTSRDAVAIAGAEHDSVFALSRQRANQALDQAPASLGSFLETQKAEADTIAPPWLGFSLAIPDQRALSRAERRLVSSLRKRADGYAATLINRHVSLFFTRFLAKTSVLPNQVTVFCFISALTGSFFIARGDYWGGVIGFLLVELGSILDGIDGELARIKYRFSRLGQWMDTVTDDISNVCFATATIITLHGAGVEWAVPLGVAALIAFVLTQATQYYFIAVVYKSGDLAAIPWAFQSTEFLESRPKELWPLLKAAIPKFLKRDFVVTFFVLLAVLGRLDIILLIWSAGTLSFLVAFSIQLVRHLRNRDKTPA